MHTVAPVGKKVAHPVDNSMLVHPDKNRPRESKAVHREMVDLRVTGRQEGMIDGLIHSMGKGKEKAMLEPIIARGQARGTGAPTLRKGEPIAAFSPRTGSHFGQRKVVAQN
jgi:hypothetical protein